MPGKGIGFGEVVEKNILFKFFKKMLNKIING